MRPAVYARTLAMFAVALAALTLSISSADARPMPGPDVRLSAPWAADVAPGWLTTAGDLCRGFRPSDLEAYDVATGARLGDDLLRYVPSPMPGFLPPVILSGYPRPARVYGWCG
jgi:hypothetical protein